MRRDCFRESSPAPRKPNGSEHGFVALCGALALGGLGDSLLRVGPWGLNFSLWIAALILGMVFIARWQKIELAGDGIWLAPAGLALGLTFAWRDSPTLRLCNALALISAASLMALNSREGLLVQTGLSKYLVDGIYAVVRLPTALPLLVFRDVHWSPLQHRSKHVPLLAAGRGFVLAIPLLLLFGGLFAAADAAFESLIRELRRWYPDDIWSHLLFILLFGWLAAAMLRISLVAKRWDNPAEQESGGVVGIVEIGVVLGLLNALFLTFVVVQARYFFGGAATMAVSPELTYADYARRGFFELVAVAGLTLPLLLLAHWALNKAEPAQEHRFRLLAGPLVLLLFAIMASAILRMRLYQEIYGQTELRFYTTAFMLWLGVVLVWFIVTVLRGQRGRFAFGVLISGLAAVLLLNAINPDSLIVRTNAGRSFQADITAGWRSLVKPQPLDERYLLSLSADAVPTLIDSLASMPEANQPAVARQILARWSAPGNEDWRTWSWARHQAWRSVQANRDSLTQIAGS